MTEKMPWFREAYLDSISSRCWAYTPYDQGWDRCPELQCDKALRCLFEQEKRLEPVPRWAQDIVERSINFPPFCPHWAFPSPYLDVLDAIGKQTPQTFVHGCYTASRERKERMLDYVFCLDAWLAGAVPRQAALELSMRGNADINWQQVCAALWEVLGERSELKELLLRRIVHRQRWWIKSLVWDDDHRNLYCRDQFLGDTQCGGGNEQGHYGNPRFYDPYFAELQVPEVQQIERRLSEICPDWSWFQSFIHDSWLCAPKAFRFIERLLWCVGKEKRAVSLPSHPLENGDIVPGFLQCEDTYSSIAGGKEWVRDFIVGMRLWVSGCRPNSALICDVYQRLAERTPIKLWLVGLYLRKIELLDPFGAVELT
ncbi:MAG: hypothetical protein LLG44_09440 [Chloroflexi bacterium]|nr:hypothetical protein [Chloroflexota bacterium]